MSITYTPQRSSANIHFSAAGTHTGTYTAGQFVIFKVLVNGVTQNGKGSFASVGALDGWNGEAHNVWGSSFICTVPVNPGVSNTITIQWDFESLFGGNVLYTVTTTQPGANRSLIITE
jgi:hypothetical protein